ncbi:mucin-16, partial [Erinaceus europaeus]|uniref:Mucin-16 n=1 Tax=Erinaceus europaeus TaxID=9365 RepID=A0ABM3WUH4_ERIEU
MPVHFSSPTATWVPSLVPFTLNFTISNLYFEDDMLHPGSWKFNSTQRILQGLLQPLFRKSSLGILYSGCRLASLRPEKHKSGTRVDAICTYRSDPLGPSLDREQLFWELRRETHGVTQLGPYTLDPNSLYVDGYTQRSSAATTSTPGPALTPFTLNFTITNLHFKEDMQHPGSRLFTRTQSILQGLLKVTFRNSSLGPRYYGCRLSQLRPMKDREATGVDIICTYLPDPKRPQLDREKLYWELITHGITQLGPYTLDHNSLYVNGYTQQTSTTTSRTTVSTLLPLTLNFTITNLHYKTSLGTSGSEEFHILDKYLQQLLTPLLNSSSLGPLHPSCRLSALWPEKHKSGTKVDAICTYRPDPLGPGLDREQLFWELSRETHEVTQLGSLTLDPNSLYVNGFTHQALTSTPSHPVTSALSPATSRTPFTTVTAPGPALTPFTLNFTITNLHFKEDMQRPGSRLFTRTQSILQGLLRVTFRNSSLGPRYYGCRLSQLRPEKDMEATGVDAICTYLPDPKRPQLDREKLYWDLIWLTKGISQLGPYTLDQNSLYVNGYSYQIKSTTPRSATVSTIFPSVPTPLSSSSAPGPEELTSFTLNFTITNLHFEEDMQPDSAKFNTTETVLQHLLKTLFTSSSIGPRYRGFRLITLRPENGGAATGVDAVCMYRSEPTGPGLDRKQLYWELSQLTLGITQLGPYTLDKASLSVNGYTKPMWTSVPSAAATEPPVVPFTLNFTITNVQYTDDMWPPGSQKFNVTEKVLRKLLGSCLKRTSVGPLYSSCRLAQLRPEKHKSGTR